MNKMKFSEILNNVITFKICKYLDFKYIIDLRLTCKDVKYYIDKTPKYKNLAKVVENSKLGYKDINKNINKVIKYKAMRDEEKKCDCDSTVLILFLSPIFIIAGVIMIPGYIISEWIQQKRHLNNIEKSYKRVKSIYIWSLTNKDYIEITKMMLEKYPEILFHINSTIERKDLLICFRYENYLTLEFLLEKIAEKITEYDHFGYMKASVIELYLICKKFKQYNIIFMINDILPEIITN